MPFIQRIIEPVFVSRPSEHERSIHTTNNNNTSNKHIPCDNEEFTTIANCTLSNVVRQLASVVLIADEIMTELNGELQIIRSRTEKIKERINNVGRSLEDIDSTVIYKKNPNLFVDEVPLDKKKRCISTSLFTEASRPKQVRILYEKAAAAPVLVVNSNEPSDDCFLFCSPVFGASQRRIKKKIDAEIETRIPAAIEDLRKWTSTEAIGDVTVSPNCLSNVGSSTIQNHSALADNSYASFSTSYVDGIDVTASNDVLDATNDIPLDHKLPSPEEQCHSIAQKFAAEIVPVNTSSVRFERMCSIRRSLGHVPMGSGRQKQHEEFQAVRRSTRPRKAVGKRRNTIAGIEDKDIKEAFTQRNSMQFPKGTDVTAALNISRSKSNDLLRSASEMSAKLPTRFNHFKALKQWGKHRLKLINRNSDGKIEEIDEEFTYSASVPETKQNKSKQRAASEKLLKQDPLYSSSEKIFTSLVQADKKFAVPAAAASVKLRASMSRRQKRNQQQRSDEPNSSSGNWSASSESGRTSASSEITMHTKSSTSSLNHNQHHHNHTKNIVAQRKFLNASTSSSITSEDTTLNHEVPIVLSDLYDDETSSMYSCDTEGYFTSFHVDSGLKTLKEEEIPPVPALLSTSALVPSTNSSLVGDKTILSVESDYELFGKGSTSTTASSAGTVCTALLGSLSNGSLAEAPNVPERKSSLNPSTKFSKFHTISNYGKPKSLCLNNSLLNRSESLKSNTEPNKSSLTGPYQLAAKKPIVAVPEVEHSENSDVDGIERVKRIRGKTLINSNRIPSICVITPLNSDDEDRVAAMGNMLTNLSLNEGIDYQIIAQVHKENDLDKQENVTASVSECKHDLSLMNISPFKQASTAERNQDETDGEYVTIAGSCAERYNAIQSNLDAILAGSLDLTTEYVSLNELPLASNYNDIFAKKSKAERNSSNGSGQSVVRNPNGLFVYDSSTLRYKRSLCTTFKNPLDEPKNSASVESERIKGALEKNLEFNAGDGDYVTLSQTARAKSPFYVQDKNEIIRLQKSATWPATTTGSSPVKESNKFRRFSWEFLSRRKKPKLQTTKIHHKQFVEKLTKSKSPFKTSTPLKQELDKNSANFSQSSKTLTPVRSHKPDEVRNTKCSDRLGAPKTALNDFKKLLLTTAGKRPTAKPSAVEQLKLRKDQCHDTSAIKILELTHSPRAFTNRRLLLHQGNSAPPYKKTNVLSPRSKWKYNNFNKNTISSIPEVEDDVSNVPGPSEELGDTKGLSTSNRGSSSPKKPTEQTNSNVIETNISMRDNIFLQAEENNFMKGEIRPYRVLASQKTQKNNKSKFLAKTHIIKSNESQLDTQALETNDNTEAKCSVTRALETSF